MKKEIEIYDDDVALIGKNAPPKAKNINDLIKYLATISHRFGDTAVEYSVSWGASALNKRANNEKKTGTPVYVVNDDGEDNANDGKRADTE